MSETHIRRSSLQAEVCSKLRTEIIEGVWKPGARLQERALCERYGISRSPLREAYQTLATEGLIDLTINRGAIVSRPTTSLTLQNFQLLRALELLGVELACRNASDEEMEAIARLDNQMVGMMKRGNIREFLHANNAVHRAIIIASGNQPLADAHLITSRQIIRVQNLDERTAHDTEEGKHQHHEIVEAMKARRRNEAVRLFKHHFDTVEDNLRSRLESFDYT